MFNSNRPSSTLQTKGPLFLATVTFIALAVLITTAINTKKSAIQQGASHQVLGTTALATNKQLIRLKIPKIEVSADIEYVGIAKDGSMDTPRSTSNVGWFSGGTFPGQNGSAVIAGHLTTELGEAAVFSNLHSLQEGDTVSVEFSDESQEQFIVTGTRILDSGPAEGVFSQSGGEFLNLVTCDGTWDAAKNTYTKRLVVFTKRINT